MRKKVKSRPRISVFRSNKHIYAQIIDDDRGVTLFTMNDKNLVKGKDKKKRELTKKEEAFLVGENLAKEALKKMSEKSFLTGAITDTTGELRRWQTVPEKEDLIFDG